MPTLSHDTCAPAVMAGSAAHPMAMGDGQTARERVTQVSDVGSEGTGAGGDGGRARRSSPMNAQWGKRTDV
jgi:hypothetical protein